MQNSFIPVSSATVGGLTKAMVLGFTGPTISFPQILEVSIYAVISATIGYMIKLGIDQLKNALKRRKMRKSDHYKIR